ncbi:MAG: hypothetical protein CR986_00835 [Ignavibacteriae bacterium]|nr:MAG: hypothetical protein CR986_00835 [Ignavibacteriota bacterium]
MSKFIKNILLIISISVFTGNLDYAQLLDYNNSNYKLIPKKLVYIKVSDKKNKQKFEENRSTSNNGFGYTYKTTLNQNRNNNFLREITKPQSLTKVSFYKKWWFFVLLIVLFFLLVYVFYFIKTYQVKKRNEALMAMVKDRTKELQREKNKSDELLLNILPASLVAELKVSGKVRPRRFNNVSIMFTDFKAFTYTTSVLPPEELVNELNEIFKGFDSIVSKYGLEKLKTIGDSYMAVCGIPTEIKNHAINTVKTAFLFQSMIKERNKTSPIKWEMRLGIHSGSVVAGVVGTKKFTYDIWGDTVNIASRMESAGEAGEINISGYTYMLVRDFFECEYRGKVAIKGKGNIDMYYVKDFAVTEPEQKIYKTKNPNLLKQFS